MTEELTPHEARLKRIAALHGKALEDIPSRVLVSLDEDVVEAFKLHAQAGVYRNVDDKDWPPESGYACLINEVLREWLEAHGEEPLLTGDSCARLRSSIGLSQGELARLAEVSRQTISDFESGRKQTRWRIVHRIAKALATTKARLESPIARGCRLRDRRTMLGLTMDHVAQQAGISRRTIYLLETGGRSRAKTVEAVERVLSEAETLANVG